MLDIYLANCRNLLSTGLPAQCCAVCLDLSRRLDPTRRTNR